MHSGDFVEDCADCVVVELFWFDVVRILRRFDVSSLNKNKIINIIKLLKFSFVSFIHLIF